MLVGGNRPPNNNKIELILCIIIINIVIIPVITFIQAVYNYVPEANCVSSVYWYSAAAVCASCCVISTVKCFVLVCVCVCVCVQWPIWLFFVVS